ncbi:MAG: YqaE/Pmp3 family membrane protein, partial [Desulfococcaceae bacterium]|nr:YqaE/Pmp3 family membrane protein [Desulfococcaceae bacterium]
GLGLHFWINIILTLLGYIPGLIHAVWIITKK